MNGLLLELFARDQVRAHSPGNCALPRTGIFRIGKLQLAYDGIKVVRKNKNRGVESDRFPHGCRQQSFITSFWSAVLGIYSSFIVGKEYLQR